MAMLNGTFSEQTSYKDHQVPSSLRTYCYTVAYKRCNYQGGNSVLEVCRH